MKYSTYFYLTKIAEEKSEKKKDKDADLGNKDIDKLLNNNPKLKDIVSKRPGFLNKFVSDVSNIRKEDNIDKKYRKRIALGQAIGEELGGATSSIISARALQKYNNLSIFNQKLLPPEEITKDTPNSVILKNMAAATTIPVAQSIGHYAITKPISLAGRGVGNITGGYVSRFLLPEDVRNTISNADMAQKSINSDDLARLLKMKLDVERQQQQFLNKNSQFNNINNMSNEQILMKLVGASSFIKMTKSATYISASLPSAPGQAEGVAGMGNNAAKSMGNLFGRGRQAVRNIGGNIGAFSDAANNGGAGALGTFYRGIKNLGSGGWNAAKGMVGRIGDMRTRRNLLKQHALPTQAGVNDGPRLFNKGNNGYAYVSNTMFMPKSVKFMPK